MEKFQKLALLIDAENIALDKLESVIQEISVYEEVLKKFTKKMRTEYDALI